MELPDFICLGTQEPALKFLVIGGWAVAAHGNPRTTFDVDFMVRRADRDAWFARAAANGLTLFGESRTFAQFTQPTGDSLDLMFADDPTFTPLWESSEGRAFGGSTARVPCLDHLLALKLHALRQKRAHRTAKDADDVEVLLRLHKINLADPRYEALFLKYGNRDIYDTFLRILRHP